MRPRPPRKAAPQHIAWLTAAAEKLQTADGRPIKVLHLDHQPDDAVLSAWAKHFRSHYCDDAKIDELRGGTPFTRAQYLEQLKFPDSKAPPGPSIRSGDFAELLIADYLEFLLAYWVPRPKYA